MIRRLFAVILTLVLISSCVNDNDGPKITILLPTKSGFTISGEETLKLWGFIKDEKKAIDKSSITAKIDYASDSTQDIDLKLTKSNNGRTYHFLATIDQFEQGRATLIIDGKNKDGKKAKTRKIRFSVDTLAPVIELGVTDGQLFTESAITVPITITDSSETTTKIFLGDTLVSESDEQSFDVSLTLQGGINTLRVESVDELDNETSVKEVSLILDATPLTLSNVSPVSNTQVNDANIVISGESSKELQSVTINGQDYPASGTSFAIPVVLPNQGVNQLSISARGAMGSTSTPIIRTINLDSIKPQVSVSPIDNILEEDRSMRFNITVQESNFKESKLFLNNTLIATESTKTLDYSATLNNGVNTLKVTAFDLFGNETTTTLTINTGDYPVAAIAPSRTQGEVPLTVDFDLTSPSEISTYFLTFGNGGDYFGTTPATDVTYMSEGTFAVALLVRDQAGRGARKSLSITALPSTNERPLLGGLYYRIISSGTPIDTAFGLEIISDPDGEVIKVVWDFGDGSPLKEVLLSEEDDGYQEHRYQSAGTYQVSATAVDNEGGQTTLTQEVVLAPTELPIFNEVVSPQEGEAPLTVTFDLTGAVDSDGTIVRYRYRFDDGTPEVNNETNEVVTHTYTEPGTYHVRLVLQDDSKGYTTKYVTISVFDEQGTFPTDLRITPYIRVGGKNPTLSFDLGDDIILNGTTVKHFEWDYGDGTQRNLPFVEGETNNSYHEHTYTTNGIYQVTCVIVAENGERSDPITRTVDASENMRPDPIYEVDRIKGASPLTINANALKARDLDGEIVRYRWRMGDGTRYDGEHEKTITHTYTEPGRYRVELRVYDDKRAIRYARFHIFVDQDSDTVGSPPIALINIGERFGESPFTVSFNGDHSFDPDSDLPLTYEWDFGDFLDFTNNTSTEANPSHTYTSGGLYYARLTVTDVDGNQAEEYMPVFVYDDRNFNNETFIIEKLDDLHYEFRVGGDILEKFPIDRTSIAWDFGDGAKALRDLEIDHNYQEDGIYDVVLTLRDLRGNYFNIERQLDTTFTPEDLVDANFSCMFTTATSINCSYENYFQHRDYISQVEWFLNGSPWPYDVLNSRIFAYQFFHEDVSITLKVTTLSGRVVTETKEVIREASIGIGIDIDCQSTFNNALECESRAVGGNSNLYTYTWSIDGVEVGNEASLVVPHLTSGSRHVSLHITDGQLQGNIQRRFTVENTIAGNANCTSLRPLMANCSIENLSQSEGLSFKWLYNGSVIGTEATLSYQFNQQEDVDLTIEVQRDSDIISKEITLSLLPHYRSAQINCQQTKSNRINCHSLQSYSTTPFSQQWIVDGVDFGSAQSIDVNFTTADPKEVRLIIQDTFGSQEKSLVIGLNEEFEEVIASSGTISLIDDISGFHPLEKPLNFSVNNAQLLRDDDGNLVDIKVFINEDLYIPQDYQYQNNQLTLDLPFSEGSNNVELKIKDENNHELSYTFNIVNGSSQIDLALNNTESGTTKISFYRPQQESPFIVTTINGQGPVSLQNIPALDLIVLIENNYDVRSVISRAVDTRYHELDFSFDPTLNTNENYVDNLSGWDILAGTIQQSANSLEIGPDNSGFAHLFTKIKVKDSMENIYVPFNIFAQNVDAIALVKVSDPDSGQTYLQSFDARSLDKNLLANTLSLNQKVFAGATDLVIEYQLSIVTDDNSQSLLFEVMDYLIKKAYASNTPNLVVQNPVFHNDKIYTDVELLDNQQYDIGERLFNIVSGSFPDSWDYVDNTHSSGTVELTKVFSVKLRAGHNDDSIDLIQRDYFLKICPILESGSTGSSGTQCLTMKSIRNCEFVSSKLECTFNFAEGILNFRNHKVAAFFYSVPILLDPSSPSETYQSALEKINHAPVRSSNEDTPYQFNTIVSLSREDENLVSNYRYGNRRGFKGLDGFDGGDDWAALSHRFWFLQIIGRDNYFRYGDFRENGPIGSYSQTASVRFDDVSSAGVSTKAGFGHRGHNDGKEFDVRFSQVDELKDHTNIIQSRRTKQVSDFSTDGDTILSFLASPYVESLYVTNQAFNLLPDKMGAEFTARLRTIQNGFYTGQGDNKKRNAMAEQVFSGGNNVNFLNNSLSPIGRVKNEENHGNHIHINLYKDPLLSSGFDPNPIPGGVNLGADQRFLMVPDTNDKNVYNYKVADFAENFYKSVGYNATDKLYFYREIPVSLPISYHRESYNGWILIPHKESKTADRFFYLENGLIKPNPDSKTKYLERLSEVDRGLAETGQNVLLGRIVNYQFRVLYYKETRLALTADQERRSKKTYIIQSGLQDHNAYLNTTGLFERPGDHVPGYFSPLPGGDILTPIVYSYPCDTSQYEYWDGRFCRKCGQQSQFRGKNDTGLNAVLQNLVYNTATRSCFVCPTRDIGGIQNNSCSYPAVSTPPAFNKVDENLQRPNPWSDDCSRPAVIYTCRVQVTCPENTYPISPKIDLDANTTNPTLPYADRIQYFEKTVEIAACNHPSSMDRILRQNTTFFARCGWIKNSDGTIEEAEATTYEGCR